MDRAMSAMVGPWAMGRAVGRAMGHGSCHFCDILYRSVSLWEIWSPQTCHLKASERPKATPIDVSKNVEYGAFDDAETVGETGI